MSNPFFKKHIGQDNGETTRTPAPLPESIRHPEPAAYAAAPAHTPAPAARTTPAATRNVLSSDVEIKAITRYC